MEKKLTSQSFLKAEAQKSMQKILDSKEGKEFFSEPYQHVVIENFFDEELVNYALDNFPSTDSNYWDRSSDKDIEIKLRSNWFSEFDIPNGSIELVRILNSSYFLKAIAERFSVKKIIPDPYFTGGGLNVTEEGGLLDVHVDGNYHDATALNRRFNVILYLNKNWKDEYGGHFGIYDNTGKNCLKKILPSFNKLLIFNTNDKSYHGLPNPLNCPSNVNRKSIILYYYTKAPRPADETTVSEPHSALWVKRDNLDKKGKKTRSFE